MDAISLVLPYPPATNNLYLSFVHPKTKRIVRVKTTTAKKYHATVEQICRITRVRPFIGEVAVSLKVFRPRRVGDLDGTFKIIFDALKGFSWNDDKQITEIHAVRHEDKENPRVEITISPIGLI